MNRRAARFKHLWRHMLMMHTILFIAVIPSRDIFSGCEVDYRGSRSYDSYHDSHPIKSKEPWDHLVFSSDYVQISAKEQALGSWTRSRCQSQPGRGITQARACSFSELCMGFHVSITKIGIRTGSAICISVASSPTMNTWVSRQLRQADSTKSLGTDSTQHLEKGEKDASVCMPCCVCTPYFFPR